MLLKKDLTTSFPCAISLLPLSLQNTASQPWQKWSVQPTALSIVSHHLSMETLNSSDCSLWEAPIVLGLDAPTMTCDIPVFSPKPSPFMGGGCTHRGSLNCGCELCQDVSFADLSPFQMVPPLGPPSKRMALVRVPGLGVVMVEPIHGPGHGKVT